MLSCFSSRISAFSSFSSRCRAVALPHLGQTREELGRVRLLGSADMSFEFLTEAARVEVGFHHAHYNLPANASDEPRIDRLSRPKVPHPRQL